MVPAWDPECIQLLFLSSYVTLFLLVPHVCWTLPLCQSLYGADNLVASDRPQSGSFVEEVTLWGRGARCWAAQWEEPHRGGSTSAKASQQQPSQLGSLVVGESKGPDCEAFVVRGANRPVWSTRLLTGFAGQSSAFSTLTPLNLIRRPTI